jgi:predicted acylesterase/phospholipase RssA
VLQDERAQFRATLPENPADLWKGFPGRIAAVLSGGGARGAYEAGVLLAFQDARLPTHILTSTSIGAINAASYASHAHGFVGNARPLINGWLRLKPSTVGIDWSRYIFVLAGLIAASAGFGNFIADLLRRFGIDVRQDNPLLSWLMLGVAGLAVLYFYAELPYLFYVLAKITRRFRWRPDPPKVLSSLAANLMVMACILWFLLSTHVSFHARPVIVLTPRTDLWIGVAVAGIAILALIFRNRISQLSHKILKSPLDSGLFQNYERARFLKARINVRRLRRSRIRVVMTAADLYTGQEKFFVNRPIPEIEQDPGADAAFIRSHFETAADLIKAVIASSAFPIAYEPVPIDKGLWSDGGLVSKTPITPAIRLGADVLFLITVDPAQEVLPKIKSFFDVGMRAFDVLMARNVIAELRLLETVNQICEDQATKMGIRPEQVKLEIASRTYRYLKTFTVRPEAALQATLLDFDGKIVRPAIEQGYRDGVKAVQEFRRYLSESPGSTEQYVLRLQSAQPAGART